MGKNEVNGMTLFDCILFYLSGTFWALARANFIKYKIIKSLIGSKWYIFLLLLNSTYEL
jgi:hypothetical protein